MGLALGFAAVVFFSVLAFWKPNALLFMIASGAALMVGFQWYDVFVNAAGLTMTLMFIAYSLVCLGFAFRCLLWRERKED